MDGRPGSPYLAMPQRSIAKACLHRAPDRRPATHCAHCPLVEPCAPDPATRATVRAGVRLVE